MRTEYQRLLAKAQRREEPSRTIPCRPHSERNEILKATLAEKVERQQVDDASFLGADVPQQPEEKEARIQWSHGGYTVTDDTIVFEPPAGVKECDCCLTAEEYLTNHGAELINLTDDGWRVFLGFAEVEVTDEQ